MQIYWIVLGDFGLQDFMFGIFSAAVRSDDAHIAVFLWFKYGFHALAYVIAHEMHFRQSEVTPIN